MLSRIRKSFRNTFRRSRPVPRDEVDSRPLKRNHVRYKVALLDGTDLTFDLEKTCLGEELVKKVLLNLDLVEKDYFGLQFMDTHQVPHWLDPTKRLKKQVKIGPPYTLHFRVKFYAANPQDLHEELTRYHFFMQIKQDVMRGKLLPTNKQLIELCAYAVQSEIGDYDPQIHQGNYVSEFRFVQKQTEELERAVAKRHRGLLGMNPAECEVSYLKIGRRLENYGIDYHHVRSEEGKEVQLGLCARGIEVTEGKKRIGVLQWPHIVNISFKKQYFHLTMEGKDRKEMGDDVYNYVLPNARASKHLWKCAVEYHSFFRLVKAEAPVRRRSSFLKLGSRFRYSGRTLHQATEDDSVNARKSIRVKRARSERFAQRSTIGYIRVGSRVWARARNGDFYRAQVTDIKDKVYIKFEDGDTLARERDDEEALVYDMNPNPSEIKIGTRVIAHWSGIAAFLPGVVTKIEGNKYFVYYDDGDTDSKSIQQIRILKPPLFFGPGSGSSKIQKRLSMKATALIGPGHSFSDKAPGPRMVPRQVHHPAVESARNDSGKRIGSDSDDAFFSEFDTMNQGAAVQRPETTRTFGLFGSRSSSNASRTSSVPSRSNSSAARIQRNGREREQNWNATVSKTSATTDDVADGSRRIQPNSQYPHITQYAIRREIHARVQRDRTLKANQRRRASIEVDLIFAESYLSDEEVTTRKRRGSLPRSWKIHVQDKSTGKPPNKPRSGARVPSTNQRIQQHRPPQAPNHAPRHYPAPQNGQRIPVDVHNKPAYPPTTTRVIKWFRGFDGPTNSKPPNKPRSGARVPSTNQRIQQHRPPQAPNHAPRHYPAPQNGQRIPVDVHNKPAYPPTTTRVVYQGKSPINPALKNHQQRDAQKYIITEL